MSNHALRHVDSLTLGDPADDLEDPEKSKGQASWITGLRLKQSKGVKTSGKRAHERKMLVIEQVPEAGPKCIENRDENYHFAQTFSPRVDVLTGNMAEDFYLCFRIHMYNVLLKLREVKVKADVQEEKILEDPQIEYLEKRLAWFMTESLRLDTVCKNLKRQVDEEHDRVDSLVKSCQALRSQAQAGQRRNKILWAATERARLADTNAASLTSLSKSRSAAALPAVASSATVAASAQAALLKRTSSGSGSLRGSPSVGALPPLTSSLGAIQGLKQQMDNASLRAAAGSEKERWYTDTIKEMRLQLEQIQKEAASFRQARGASLGGRSQMEEFFLRSMSEARRDLPRMKRERKGREPRPDEKILDMLLGSEQVLVTLYEGLFPHRAGLGHRFLALKAEAATPPPVGEVYTSQQVRTVGQ